MDINSLLFLRLSGNMLIIRNCIYDYNDKLLAVCDKFSAELKNIVLYTLKIIVSELRFLQQFHKITILGSQRTFY